MEFLSYFQYNSFIILSFFFICLISLIINFFTGGKSNDLLFSSYRSSLLNPLTYIRFVTHIFGHSNFEHFMNNFLLILLVGPMIEEKYGSLNLLIAIIITGAVTGIINSIFSKKKILGSSGIVFMLIVLSSFVNIETGKIPVTFVLICIFYLFNEVFKGLFKKDNISHMSHLIGALCGFILGFYIF